MGPMMDDPGQQIVWTAVMVAAIAAALALPLLTVRRLRTRGRRRDEQLAANAQPGLTMVSHGLAALLALAAVSACGAAALAGHPFLWAPAWIGGGILVSSIISAAVVFRAPPGPEDER